MRGAVDDLGQPELRDVLTGQGGSWPDEQVPITKRDADTCPRTLAEKIEHLFAVVHPPGRGPYTLDEVAEEMARCGGPTMSPQYLWQLRKGKRDNPNMHHIEALASFFKVHPGYFFDDDFARATDEHLEVQTLLRDERVRETTLLLTGLSSASQDQVRGLAEHLRRLERVPRRSIAVTPASPRRKREDP